MESNAIFYNEAYHHKKNTSSSIFLDTCNQTVKNVGRNSRVVNIRNQVLLAINVRQWSSFKSQFFPIFLSWLISVPYNGLYILQGLPQEFKTA